MSTTTVTKTEGTVLLTTQVCQSNAVVTGAAVDVSTKLGPAMAFVRYGRTTIGSTAAPVFMLEGRSDNSNGWVPIHTWTTAYHGQAALAQSLQSTAAAGATSIQLSAALGSALSTPIVIYNSATPANSEWNWQNMASTQPVLNWSLYGAQTASVAIALSYAEMWAIPVDLGGLKAIRLRVSNIWNAVAQPNIVSAQIVTADSASTV